MVDFAEQWLRTGLPVCSGGYHAFCTTVMAWSIILIFALMADNWLQGF